MSIAPCEWPSTASKGPSLSQSSSSALIDASMPSKASALNERTPGGSVHQALSCGAVGKDHCHWLSSVAAAVVRGGGVVGYSCGTVVRRVAGRVRIR